MAYTSDLNQFYALSFDSYIVYKVELHRCFIRIYRVRLQNVKFMLHTKRKYVETNGIMENILFFSAQFLLSVIEQI